MSEPSITHVQVKGDITATALVSPVKSPGPLAANSIRVRVSVLSLSSNTTSYSFMGSVLNWWDTFPVHDGLPSPYDDQEKYGIGPAWGFATVLESTLDIPPGSIIRGFFPLSTAPVDLCLKPSTVPGHWIEVSPHRAKVMNLYHRYIVSNLQPSSPTDREVMALDTLIGLLWGSTWLINQFSFGTKAPFIHPGGYHQPWSASDADITHAMVIILTASSKTAMGLAYELKNGRSSGSGPEKVVGVTSNSNLSFVRNTKWHDLAVNYEEALQDDGSAIVTAATGSNRVVVFDCGARGSFKSDLQKVLKTTNLPVTFVRIGGEKPVGPPKKQAGSTSSAAEEVEMVQMNASGCRDQAIEEMGELNYFEAEEAAKKTFFARGGVPGLHVTWSKGMQGQRGLEGAWERLCQHDVPADEALAVWLDAEAKTS